MTKILQVVKAMLSRQDLISGVSFGSESEGGVNELFFTFNGKYVWSILRRDDKLSLFFYPTIVDSIRASQMSSYEFGDIAMQTYRSEELGGEAQALFAKLYSFLNNKAFGIDDAFDDIIKTGDLPNA